MTGPARQKADDAVREACYRRSKGKPKAQRKHPIAKPCNPDVGCPSHADDKPHPQLPPPSTFDSLPMWRVGTYNAMSMVRMGRWDVLSREMQTVDVVGVQGLCSRAEQDFPCSYFRSSQHHVFQWGYGSGVFSNKSCGVALMLKHQKFRLHHIRQIYSPPDCLAGRAGALRLKGARADFLLVVGYVPVEPSNQAQRRGVHALFSWLDRLLSDAPVRTVPVLLLDANGRTGLHRAGPGPWQVLPGNDAAVGAWGAEVENYNGSKLHEFMLQHHLAATNTHDRHGCGKTFHGAHHASRIDYVLVPAGLLPHVCKVRVWYRSAFRLQLVDSPALRDHCPVVADFRYEIHFDHKVSEQRWDFSKLAAAIQGSDCKTQFLQEAERGLQQVQLQQNGTAPHTVAAAWRQLNNVVCSTAQKHFQLAPPGRARKPADTVHAAEQALAARLRYRDAVQSSQHSPRDLLPQRFYWRVWMAHVRFVQLQRQAKRLCRRDKRARRSELVEQLASAARRSDLALQWKLAYQLAGGSHGPKKRRYNMPQRFRPTASEWVEELVQSGPAGGCSARTLNAFSTSEVVSGLDVGTATLGSFADYNGSPMSIPPVQVEVHAETLANEDFAGLCASVRSLRRGRSVPEWSAPAEVWRLLLFPAEHLSQGHTLPPGTHGSCEGLLRTLLYLVRRNQEVPWLWNLSSPVELDKSNGKRGCAGKRLIHKLDPIGKSFFHMLWTRQGDVARHYACGFLRHRRREQAILQQRCLNWKLQKTGQSRVSVLYDVKNAFPSPSHASLDLAVCSNCRPADANLLCLRHRAAFILVRDPFKPEFTLVQIGCGNLQGDRVAPSQFLAVYHPPLDEWNDRCRRMEHGGQFVLRDPVSGLQVDTALSTFADDVARTHVVPRIADFSPTMQTLDSHFDACLGRLHMGQNHDKKELLVRLMGKGAQLAMQRIYHGHIQVRGRCQRVCKYLGSLLHHSGATSPEVSNRIAVAKRNWAIMRKFWFTRGVAASQRRLVFLAMVVSPLYSGIETLQTHDGDNVRLGRVLAALARKFCQGRACLKPHEDAHGHHRSLSNSAVFELLQIFPPAWERRARRLLWWQSIARHPGDNVSLLATVFGQYGWENGPPIGVDGRVTALANPWLRELVEDLDKLGEPNLVADQPLSIFFHPCKDLFVNLPIRTLLVRKYREELAALGLAPVENADEVAPVGPAPLRCDWIGADGAQCGYTAQSTTALSTHRHRLHGVRITARQIVVCNQCPWCRRIFASVEIAKRHAHARVKKGHCPRQGGNAAGMVEQLRPPPTFRCPVCPHEAVDLETLQTHVVGHVPAGQHVLHQYLIAAQQ